MTQEDVIVLWKDANGWDVKGYETTLKDLERFANLVAAKATAKEREACAELCDEDMVQARYFFYCLVASILQTKLRPEVKQNEDEIK